MSSKTVMDDQTYFFDSNSRYSPGNADQDPKGDSRNYRQVFQEVGQDRFAFGVLDYFKVPPLMRKNFLCIGLFLFALTFGCYLPGDVQLTDYLPKNKVEGEIVALLIEYQDAKNQLDLTRFLACLYEQGRFSYRGAAMVSKGRLRTSLPDFWKTLQSPNRIVVYPLSHEFVTGDYYLSGRLVNPRIFINGSSVDVTVTFTSGWWRQKHFLSMQRVNDRWMITLLDWEEA